MQTGDKHYKLRVFQAVGSLLVATFSTNPFLGAQTNLFLVQQLIRLVGRIPKRNKKSQQGLGKRETCRKRHTRHGKSRVNSIAQSTTEINVIDSQCTKQTQNAILMWRHRSAATTTVFVLDLVYKQLDATDYSNASLSMFLPTYLL